MTSLVCLLSGPWSLMILELQLACILSSNYGLQMPLQKQKFSFVFPSVIFMIQASLQQHLLHQTHLNDVQIHVFLLLPLHPQLLLPDISPSISVWLMSVLQLLFKGHQVQFTHFYELKLYLHDSLKWTLTYSLLVHLAYLLR